MFRPLTFIDSVTVDIVKLCWVISAALGGRLFSRNVSLPKASINSVVPRIPTTTVEFCRHVFCGFVHRRYCNCVGCSNFIPTAKLADYLARRQSWASRARVPSSIKFDYRVVSSRLQGTQACVSQSGTYGRPQGRPQGL